MTRTATIVIGLCLASLPAAATNPSSVCGARDEILARLSKDFREVPSAVGITDSGELVQVLTSPGGTTWSIMVSAPNGVSCLVAAGKDWQEKPRLEAVAHPEPQI
jgi:hypothetical protein